MGRSFMEEWLYGPHDPAKRSLVGRMSLALVNSREWEYLFLMFIVFNAGIKLTVYRIQSEEYTQLIIDVSGDPPHGQPHAFALTVSRLVHPFFGSRVCSLDASP